jgi:Uma2 family endonuclease
MSSLAQPNYTPAEYLALERRDPSRSEYLNGQILAQAGASRRHNLIAGNLFSELRLQLKGRPCEIYISDMRVKVSPTGLYTYPDVVALCAPSHFEDDHEDTLLNPAIIVEVLSPSTEAYDRGEKFVHYRRLESLQAYLLIAQDKMRIEQYVRQGDQWVLSEYSDPAASVHLEAIACDLVLQDIYLTLDFSDPDTVIT